MERLFSLHHWPSTREIDYVPSKEFLAIGIANGGIDVVVVKHWTEARVGENAPKKEEH
jgi:hypothetical protein